MGRRVRRITVGESTAELRRCRASNMLRSFKPESMDLIITSPPYCMGMEYEKSRSVRDFLATHRRILPLIERALKPGGSVCWQVGHHIRNGVLVPLDALVYQVATEKTALVLRNRIVWHFAHGTHSQKRFSGRHETVLWFTKGSEYTFELDAVRIPQRYPGKRAYKGEKKGQWSGNPRGKNPGDVWDIPNVKARHPEKTEHPCQFPVALARRLVKALTEKGQLVCDPFMGSGTVAVAALAESRNFVGCDVTEEYVEIAQNRLVHLATGDLAIRPDVPPRQPKPGEAVATAPEHFFTLQAAE